MNTAFAVLLEQRQKDLGIETQEALAAHLGTHKNTVQLYLSGKSLPPQSRVARLATDLRINQDALRAVLAADREARRVGIRIDTVAQAQEQADRLSADHAADRLEQMVDRHAQEDDASDGDFAPHDGPRTPHLPEAQS